MQTPLESQAHKASEMLLSIADIFSTSAFEAENTGSRAKVVRANASDAVLLRRPR